ncbi:hypothetical protein V1264_020244 [Littorina saxatilis]|uniref:SEFIR domain-containing protein n=1 Tax=Littorina saxatilis TaxID=31220 RepID=A0AAN9GAN5_9CAEN
MAIKSIYNSVVVLTVLFCCSLLVSPTNGSEESCGTHLPDGCSLYTSEDCKRKSNELTKANKDLVSWPERVENVHVQPYISTALSSPAPSVGLCISWALPRHSTSAVQGVKVSVTALDDASQFALCLLFDLSSVQGWTHWTNESVMSYNVTLPRLRDEYNWHVQLESLPSPQNENWSRTVASAFVSTDGLLREGPKPACSMVVAMTQSLISVTVSGVISNSAVTSYDVILYECDGEECCNFCDLTEVSAHNVKSFSETSNFARIAPGLYRVWVQPAGQPDNVCGRSPVLIVTEDATRISTSSPLTTTAMTAMSSPPQSTTVTNNSMIQNTTNVTPPQRFPADFTATVELTESGREHAQSSSTEAGSSFRVRKSTDTAGNDRDVVAAVSVAVCVSVVVVVLGVGACYCWRCRTNSSSFRGDLTCMEKLMKSVTRHSTPDAELQLSDLPCSILDTRRPASTVKVFLVSHSILKHHTLVSDSLALYLQAFCACDVTYFRWLLDDIRPLGPALWTFEQMEKADRVVFVHSPDTRGCYDTWKAGQTKEKEGSLEVRIIMAAFDYIFEHTASRKLFNVTFHSDLPYVDSCFFFQPSLVSQSFPASKGANPAKSEECNETSLRSTSPKSVNTRTYRLMNDFSQFLADLHTLPNVPSAFMERNLPFNADHLDTPEGRQLYKAVASLGIGEENDDDSVRGTVFGGKQYIERYHNEEEKARAIGDRFGILGEQEMKGRASYPQSGWDCFPQKELRDNPKGTDYHTKKEARLFRGSDGFHEHKEQAVKIDSGFDERCLDFIGPDELSAVDTDASSLGDRFRGLNARYKRNMEECESCADCYTLGGRYV